MPAKRVRKFGDPVVIVLDHERTLRMDMTTMYDFEQVSGKSLINGDQLSFKNMSDMSQLLWAACGGTDCDLSLREVGRMVGPHNFAEVMAALMELLSQLGVNAKPAENEAESGNADGSIG